MTDAVTLLMPLPGVAAADWSRPPTFGVPRDPQFERLSRLWLKSHPTCAACGTAEFIEVHHEFPFHLYRDLEMDERYWLPLCRRPGVMCHLNHGHAGNWSLWIPEVRVRAATHLADVLAAKARGSNRLPGG